jgi:hypothetical protein
MSNANRAFGINFESGDCASSSTMGSAPAPCDASHYDAAEAAVAKLGNFMDYQRNGELVSVIY